LIKVANTQKQAVLALSKHIIKTSEGFDYDFDNAFFDSNYSKKILPFYYHYQKIKAGNLLK
jgi:hypothetical protein